MLKQRLLLIQNCIRFKVGRTTVSIRHQNGHPIHSQFGKNPDTGRVTIQAHAIFPNVRQETAFRLCINETDTTAPTLQWVVDNGIPKFEPRRTVRPAIKSILFKFSKIQPSFFNQRMNKTVPESSSRGYLGNIFADSFDDTSSQNP